MEWIKTGTISITEAKTTSEAKRQNSLSIFPTICYRNLMTKRLADGFL